MKGSIKKRGETSYRIRVYTGKDPATGKKLYHQETVSGATKAKAEKAAEARRIEIVNEVNKGTWVSPERATFGEYLQKKWLPFAKARVRQITYDNYEYCCLAFLIPALGNIEMRKLTPLMFDSLYDEMIAPEDPSKRRYSQETAVTTHAVAHNALRRAVKWQLIAQNPTDGATAPTKPDKKPDVWTVEECAQFVEGAKNDRFYAAYLLYLTGALRRGEGAGMELSGVLFSEGGISVERSVVHTTAGYVVDKPKTKTSEGVVACSPATMEALRDVILRKAREKKAWEDAYGPGSYVESDRLFTHEDGRPVSPECLYRRFKVLIKELGMRNITLHGLRRTGATLFYRASRDMRQVKEHLRHAQIGTTDKLYVAEIPELQKATAKELDKLLKLTPENAGCPKDVQQVLQ